jgi:hypothetical protein
VKVHEVLRRVLRRARSDDEDGGCLCHGEHKSQARNLLHCTTRESHIYPRSDFHLCRVFFPPVQMMTFIPGGATTPDINVVTFIPDRKPTRYILPHAQPPLY